MSKKTENVKDSGIDTQKTATSSVASLGTSRVYAIGAFSNERRELREQFDPQVVYDYVFGKLDEDHPFAIEYEKIEKQYEKRCLAIDNKVQRLAAA